MSFLKKFSGIGFVLVLSLFSILPLFTPGFFPVHDDTQVARVFEMKTALADGMFPVRWVPDLGYNYGYPIFNFYGPLAYYVGGLINLIGFDSLVSTKIMIGLGILSAGVFMYFLAKEFWGKTGGVVSAILYMYAPYHALNIYVRGAIGELWAYGLLPLVFFSLYKLYQSLENDNHHGSKKTNTKALWMWLAVSSVAYAAIVISHNLTAMMVTPFLFVYAVFLYITSRIKHKSRKSYFILLSLLLGIFLSGFYWLPVVFELKYTNVLSVVGGGSDYRDHFICLNQLWNSPWGFTGSIPGCVDGMSFRLGKLHLLVALFSLPLLFFLRSRRKQLIAAVFSLLVLLVSVFLTLEYSRFIWDAIPQMAFFQFPWRFLVLAMFSMSLLGGGSILLLTSFQVSTRVLGVVIIGSIIFYNLKLFAPQTILHKTAEDYTIKQELSWKISKISDEYMPPGFQKPMSLKEVPKKKINDAKGITILSYNEKTQAIQAVINTQKKTELLVNVAYFPGWHVYIDGKQEYFKYFRKGILMTVPQGGHTIDVKLAQTQIEEIGNALSLTGVLILVAGIISSRKEDYSV